MLCRTVLRTGKDCEENDEAAIYGGLARASLSAAPHQAPGGWRPAPFHFWPRGRRPCRGSLRRHLDPPSPSQISERLRPVPPDIFFLARFSSPSLPVARRNYAAARNPFQEKSTKVNFGAARAGT